MNKHNAIVTGGSGAIGLAIAAQLMRDGFDCALIGRDAGKLDRAVAELRLTGRKCDGHTLRRDAACAGAGDGCVGCKPSRRGAGAGQLRRTQWRRRHERHFR